jgi:hypothetical protein
MSEGDGDICDCINLVSISMKKIYFGSCIVLFDSFVCSRFGSARYGSALSSCHACRILVISCRRFLLVALVFSRFFSRIFLRPQDCRRRSSNRAELLVAFGSCRPLLHFHSQDLFLFFDLFWVRACQPDPLWPAVHKGLRTRSPFSSVLVLLIFGACLRGRHRQGACFLRHLSCRCFGRRSSKRQSPVAPSGFHRRRLVNRSSFSFLPGIGVRVGFGAAEIYFTAEFPQERARSFLF